MICLVERARGRERRKKEAVIVSSLVIQILFVHYIHGKYPGQCTSSAHRTHLDVALLNDQLDYIAIFLGSFERRVLALVRKIVLRVRRAHILQGK